MYNRVVFIPVLVLFIILGFNSCAPRATWKYKDVAYHSPEEMLAAQKEDLQAVLGSIKPVDQPMKGKAVIILPSESAIEQYSIRKTGRPSAEQVNHIIESVRLTHVFMADSIKKKGLFESVSVKFEKETENVPFAEDFAVFLVLRKDGRSQWFLSRKRDNPITPQPVFFNNALDRPEDRTASFLDSIEKAARK